MTALPDAAADENWSRATVVPYPDGPLIIRGDFALEDATGQTIEHSSNAVALCRCGRSRVKPFCDGNHKRLPRADAG